MKVLKSLADQLADYIGEAGKLNNMELTAKEELERLLKTGDANLEDARTLQRVTECQARIALVPPRRKKIAALIEQTAERVKRYRNQLVGEFGNFVHEKREARFNEVIDAILPYWEHDKRAARRHFEREHIPYVDELRFCAWNYFDPEMTPEKELEFARVFLAHVAKCAKKFGWTDTEWHVAGK
jgi:hypothetical protein